MNPSSWCPRTASSTGTRRPRLTSQYWPPTGWHGRERWPPSGPRASVAGLEAQSTSDLTHEALPAGREAQAPRSLRNAKISAAVSSMALSVTSSTGQSGWVSKTWRAYSISLVMWSRMP